MISNKPSTDLRLARRGAFWSDSVELSDWGNQWSQYFGMKAGIKQAWVARVDSQGVLQWISNFPKEVLESPFPESVLQAVAGDGKTRMFPIPQHSGTGGLFPLEHAGRIIGIIGLLGNHIESLNPDVIESIAALSAIITHDLFQAEFRSRERSAESSINRLLQSSLDIRNILPAILEILSNILQADAIKVHSYNPSARKFEVFASYGWLGSSAIVQEITPAMLELINNKSSVWIEDIQTSRASLQPIHRIDEALYRGYLALPLIGHNDPSGLLEIAWNAPHKKHKEEFGLLERIAEQIAFVMERSVILQDLRQLNQSMTLGYDALVEGLSRTLELRDFETEGHTRRVSQLTMRLVEHMKIPAEQWDFIRRGALLHDIGKLGVPDAILLKPGSLTNDERRMMEQHVVYGHTILTPIINTIQILDIVLHHHERWDGTGYPDKQKGTQIPLVARLFAVVDVFDALTSDRPYRTSWSREHALDFIKEQAGKQFDPMVVEYFLEIANEIS